MWYLHVHDCMDARRDNVEQMFLSKEETRQITNYVQTNQASTTHPPVFY